MFISILLKRAPSERNTSLWSQDQNLVWSNMPKHLQGNDLIKLKFYFNTTDCKAKLLYFVMLDEMLFD